MFWCVLQVNCLWIASSTPPKTPFILHCVSIDGKKYIHKGRPCISDQHWPAVMSSGTLSEWYYSILCLKTLSSPFDAIHRLPLCHSVAAAQDDTGSSSNQVLKGQYKSISCYNILYNICTVCVWYLFDMLHNICIVFQIDCRLFPTDCRLLQSVYRLFKTVSD